MAHCKSYAKDLFRERPAEPEALLKDMRFWDVTFLELYLDHCDEVLFDQVWHVLENAFKQHQLALPDGVLEHLGLLSHVASPSQSPHPSAPRHPSTHPRHRST